MAVRNLESKLRSRKVVPSSSCRNSMVLSGNSHVRLTVVVGSNSHRRVRICLSHHVSAVGEGRVDRLC